MPASQPIPILVTGGKDIIGRQVKAALEPEYEVIHFTLITAITEELPVLLTGKPPSAPSSTVGSGNWSDPPRALLLGGAYQDDDIERLQKLVQASDGAAKIPWLRVDVSKRAPPAQDPDENQAREYGMDVARRMKETLNKLDVEGKLGQGNDGVYKV